MENPDTTTRICNRCKKKFILSKGFYKNGLDSNGNQIYRYDCKKCHTEISLENGHIRRDYVFDNHSWVNIKNEVYKCKRCGMLKRRKASYKPGIWISEYYVNMCWSKEHPICIE